MSSDKDLQFMQDAGLNVVRIGEFAWSSEEPSEGQAGRGVCYFHSHEPYWFFWLPESACGGSHPACICRTVRRAN